ncbi:MAG: DegT/DnrJ/EryC1/StrS family aminotransferase [Candidatus Methanomethylicaceae archaeon]
MDELSAAFGVSQLRKIETFLEKREKVANMYTEKLRKCSWIRPPIVKPYVRMSWFVYVVTLEKGLDRDKVILEMEKRGIPARGYFSPIHLQPYIREMLNTKDGMLPITEDISKRTLALPFHNNLTEDEIDEVVNTLKEIIENM